MSRLTADAEAKGGRFCVGCAHYIYPPEQRHPEKCPIGQLEARDRRIETLEKQVARLTVRLSGLLAEHGQAL